MRYEDLLRVISEDSLVVAVQCNHHTDIDETCSIGRGLEVSNLRFCCDYEVERLEYVNQIKTLSKDSRGSYKVTDYKEGGYVVYIRPKNKEARTLYLKGLTYEDKKDVGGTEYHE